MAGNDSSPRRAPIHIRVACGTALVLGIVLGSASPAAAHAILQASTPADGAHLDTAPTVVTLTFSEDVSASLGAVRVFDGSGKRVDQGNVVARDNTVTVGMQHVGDGGYVVTWRVISADSHPVRGAFSFTVGSGTAVAPGQVSSLLESGSDRFWDVAADVARAIAYGGVLLAAGGAIFLAVAHDGRADRHRLAAVVLSGAVTGAVGVLATLPVSAALATGLGVGAITHEGVLGQVLADGVAAQTAVALVGLALASFGVLARRRTMLTRAIAVVGGVAAALSFSFAGHTTTTSPRWLVYGADVVHVVAAATWLGGILLLLLFLVWRHHDRGDAIEAGIVVARFSALATVAIVVVLAAGSTLAYEEVRALHALTSTSYGRLVLVKIGLFAVVGSVGAYNHFRLVPALRSAEARGRDAWHHLVRTVQIESLGLLAVVAVTAVLVNAVPARTAAGVGTIFSATKPLGADSVNLVVDPNRAGRVNSVHLYVLDATGRVADVPNVTIELSLPANDLGPLRETPFQAGPGHYQLDTSDLSVRGKWLIVVRAQISKFQEVTASFDVQVNP